MLAGRRSPFRHACSEVSVCREGWRRRRGGAALGRLQTTDMAQELRLGFGAQAPADAGLGMPLSDAHQEKHILSPRHPNRQRLRSSLGYRTSVEQERLASS